MATTIAHASVNVGQGGPSNLQRFKAHHPPTFKGGGEPMEAYHWYQQVGKILEAMEIAFDAKRTRLAAFQIEGESSMVGLGQSYVSSSLTNISRHLHDIQKLGSSQS